MTFEKAVVINNLILPFLVASFEAFLKEFFIAYIDTTPALHAKVYARRKRFDAEVVEALLSGVRTLGQTEAANFTFQNIASANAAYVDYLDINLYELWRRKRKFAGKYYVILDLIDDLLARRHNIIHSAELELQLNANDVDRYAHGLQAAAERLVSHLQREKAFRIDLEEIL